MRAIGCLGLCVVSLVLALQGSAAAQTGEKNKTVRITNQQGAAAEVYVNFAADSVLKPTDLPFCRVTGQRNCQFTLAPRSSQDFPNPQAKYLNMALAFNAPVTCGSTKAEVLVNNPSWYDVLDVSVVDGFNETIQMNVTPTVRQPTHLGPPVGQPRTHNALAPSPSPCASTTSVG